MPTWRLLAVLLLCLATGCRSLREVMQHTPPASAGADDQINAGAAVAAAPYGLSFAPELAAPLDHREVRLAAFQDSPPRELPPGVAPPPLENLPPPLRTVESPSAWTLADLEQMALSNHPTLAEKWAAVEAARGRWLQAGLPPNVILGYSGQQLGSRGLAEQQGVYIEQQFVRLRKLEAGQIVASQEMLVAEQQWAVQRQRILTDVRTAYYQALAAQRNVELAEQLLEIAREALQTSQALLRALEVSEVDVLRATVELQATQLSLQTSYNGYAAAWSNLTAVLGAPGLPPRSLAGNLESELPELTYQEALARLLAESPELAAAMADVERARAAVEQAQVQVLPDVDVQGIIQHDNGIGSSDGNLQVTLPIPWLNRNQGAVREARANLVAAQQAVGRIELSLHQRLAGAYQQYANARNQADAYARRGGILENARRTLDLTEQAYRAGQLGHLELLTAQRTNAQTNLAYVQALADLQTARAQIDGLLLTGSLNDND